MLDGFQLLASIERQPRSHLDPCVHCGHGVIERDDNGTPFDVHAQTGSIACPNGSGHIACPPQGGVE